LQKTPLADIADINIFGRTDIILNAIIEKLGLTIPDWKLKRKFKMGNIYDEKEQIWRFYIRGVDRDNEDLAASLFKTVNVKLPKGYSKKALNFKQEPYLFSDKVGTDTTLDVTFSFRGHYNEPPLTISYDLLFEGEGKEVTYLIEFSPRTESWETGITNEVNKPNDGTFNAYDIPQLKTMGILQFDGKLPTPRLWSSSSICYDDDSNPHLVISGGESEKAFPYFSILNINNNNWTNLNKDNKKNKYPIENTWGHSSSVVGDLPKEIYLFGGCASNVQYNSMAKYNFETNEMIILETEGNAPSPRFLHTATVYGSKIIIFGGVAYKDENYEFYEDVFIFNTDDNTWSELKCKGDKPQPRAQHGATLVNNQLVIIGGYTKTKLGTSVLNDVWVLNLKKKTWREMKCGGEGPTGFYSLDEDSRLLPFPVTTSLIDAQRGIILVFGICHYWQPEATIYLLDTENWIWTKINNDTLPGIQCPTSSNLKDNEVLIFGYNAHLKSKQNEVLRICY